MKLQFDFKQKNRENAVDAAVNLFEWRPAADGRKLIVYLPGMICESMADAMTALSRVTTNAKPIPIYKCSAQKSNSRWCNLFPCFHILKDNLIKYPKDKIWRETLW